MSSSPQCTVLRGLQTTGGYKRQSHDWPAAKSGKRALAINYSTQPRKTVIFKTQQMVPLFISTLVKTTRVGQKGLHEKYCVEDDS